MGLSLALVSMRVGGEDSGGFLGVQWNDRGGGRFLVVGEGEPQRRGGAERTFFGGRRANGVKLLWLRMGVDGEGGHGDHGEDWEGWGNRGGAEARRGWGGRSQGARCKIFSHGWTRMKHG